MRLREREVALERSRLDGEGLKEWRAKVRDLERQVESLLKDFSYRIRETVQAIDDRAARQKLSKEAERRVARLRREFSEQFNATVVAQYERRGQGRWQRATASGAARAAGGDRQAQVVREERPGGAATGRRHLRGGRRSDEDARAAG